jgi:RimJ/RimL family protein N-acetyltransferase
MSIELLPIRALLHENTEFLQHPDCEESLQMAVSYYWSIGYHPPWIGYYASLDGELVGSAGFKGKPVEGKVELAYGTFPSFQRKGIGAAICKALVTLAQNTDPSVRITARTLPTENYSTRILKKNSFVCLGEVIDPDDGEVWEWEFERAREASL